MSRGPRTVPKVWTEPPEGQCRAGGSGGDLWPDGLRVVLIIVIVQLSGAQPLE